MRLSAPLAGWPLATADSWVPEHDAFSFNFPSVLSFQILGMFLCFCLKRWASLQALPAKHGALFCLHLRQSTCDCSSEPPECAGSLSGLQRLTDEAKGHSIQSRFLLGSPTYKLCDPGHVGIVEL